MIKEKLLIMEYNILQTEVINSPKANALKQLKTALNEVDFNSEIIPLCDYNRLQKLFKSLLKRELNIEELSIIEKLIDP